MADKITIYKDASYGGSSLQLDPGAYDLGKLSLGSDQISSLKIPKGLKVTLFENGNFSGRSKIFMQDTPYVGDDFNDIASAIKVEIDLGRVSIYGDANFTGSAQEMGEGNYDVNGLIIGTDKLSSLKVPKGIKVTLFENGGYSGRSKVFTQDTPYVGDDFNDITSSIKIESLLVPPVVSPASVTAIRDQGSKFADAGKPLADGYKTNPPDNAPQQPISQLIKSGVLPQYDLSKKLTIQDNKLTLSKDVLGNLGEAGNMVSSILNVFITIENPTINFVRITPGKSGVPGQPLNGDASQDNTASSPQSVALQLSGDTTLFSSLRVKLEYAEFSISPKLKPYGLFKFKGLSPIGVGSFLPNVPLMSGMNISEPVIVASSMGDMFDPILNYGIAKGFNFFGKFKLGASQDKVFKFVGGLLGIDEILLHGVVDLGEANASYLLEASIPIDRYIVNGDNFKLKLSQTTLGLSIKGKPLEPALILANEVIVTLKMNGNITNLVLIGGIKVETESITGSFTMLAKNDKPYTSLSGNIVAAGEWKEPFGIPGITIRELAMQIGGTYEAPWIDNVGVHGNLKIGDLDGSISVLVDANDPDQFVLAGATDHITIVQILTSMTPVTFVAYQALPDSIKNMMNKFINLTLQDVKISIVPSATSIGAINFDDEGVTVMGKLTAWGWHAKAYINVSPIDGLNIEADMDNINLYNVLSITGAQNDPCPILKVKISKKEAPNLLISSKITLLGSTQELYIKLNENGLTFYFERTISNILTAKLTCSIGDYNMVAGGIINFNLNLNLPTSFGNIKLVNVSFDASSTMRVGVSYGFQTVLSGSFQFYGKSVTMPTLNVTVAPRDFQGFYDAVSAQIKNNAESLFRAVFATLTDWTNAVKNGAIQYSGEVANVAKNVYQASEQDMINAYKTLNKGANEIASGLKSAYAYSSKDVAIALKGAGYAVDVVGSAVQNAYNLSSDGMAIALKGAGYAVDQVGNFVKNTWNLGPDALKKSLEAAGYAGDQIKGFFNNLGGAFKSFFTDIGDKLNPTKW